MNGLDNISNKIIAEAEQQAAKITAEAKLQAQDIIAKAEQAAAKEIEQGQASIDARVADMAEKARIAATLERRRLVATTHQKLISTVFTTALERLRNLPPEQYQKLLITLAENALSDREGGELILNAADRAAYGEAVVQKLNAKGGEAVTLSEESRNIPGGVIIKRGNIELNCALDVTVRILSDSMANEVNRMLFPEGA